MSKSKPLVPLNLSPKENSRKATSVDSHEEDEHLKISVKISDRDQTSRLSDIRHAYCTPNIA